MLLQERWAEVAASHANELAVLDVSSSQRWTFGELARRSEFTGNLRPDRIVFPSGVGVEFILDVLRGWRSGAVVCPLETGAVPVSVPTPPNNIAHLKLTSGTTGAAKCVAFTAAQLAADADAIVKTMGLAPIVPNLGVISLAHSYGFSNLVLPLLLHGIPLILAPSPLPAALTSAAKAFGNKPIALAAVPAMWRAWHAAAAIPPETRIAISAGAPLPLQVEQDIFDATGIKLHNFLGASECGGIAFDAMDVPRTDASLAGTPMHGISVEAAASDGRLTVRSPAVGESYWPEPDDALRNGVFISQDLVEIGNGGSILLRGRASDIINVAGRKVSPETIEAVLRQHPSVKECLVLGIQSNGDRGETVAAIIETETDGLESKLREFALTQLPAWQVPRVWRFEQSIQANHRGKISRAEWRRRLAAD